MIVETTARKKRAEPGDCDNVGAKLQEMAGEMAGELSRDKYKRLWVYLAERKMIHLALHKRKSRMPSQDELSEMLSNAGGGGADKFARGRNKSFGVLPMVRGRGASLGAEHATIDVISKEGEGGEQQPLD